MAKFIRALDSDKSDEILLKTEQLEVLAKAHSLHLIFSRHAKKRDSDDPGDGIIGSTSFRGSTDTNLYLKQQRDTRPIISAEQRWGVALEPTILAFDPERCAR